MPHSNRPGDVLADRYRLVDLLSESGTGRFWRAHDRILQRRVALHVIAAGDERADGLLDAARRSATVLDRRILRVLDAERVDGLCYVVNEWGTGTSLDVMLANEGPLAPRRAAWLVSEVADAITSAHEAGVAHGRLSPENVLLDRSGSIRIIGLAVDAALHGLPPDRMSVDVIDLGGLLYSALTGYWAGISTSAVEPAPQAHGRVLRPRRVRAGVPGPLDALCDQVLDPHDHARGRETHPTTAAGIVAALQDFCGDTTGLGEAWAARDPGRVDETIVLPPVPEFSVHEDAPGGGGPVAAAVTAGGGELPSGPEMPPDPDDEATGATAVVPDVAAPGDPGSGDDGPHVSVEQPTEAGIPIFGDEIDDVSWLTARSTPAPPPPPFDEPPERPLFAPEPVDGAPARRTRPRAVMGGAVAARAGGSATGGPAAAGGSGGGRHGIDFWPFDSGSRETGSIDAVEDEEVPGRNWFRLALAIGVGLLLLVAVVVAFNLGRGKTPLGAEPSPDPTTSTPSASAPTPGAPITGIVATDLDPQGDPPEENPDLAPLAVDGDEATAWRTMTYRQNLGPQGLKTGVGLVLDLGGNREVSEIDLVLGSGRTAVSLYLTDASPTGVADLTPIDTAKVDGSGKLTLAKPVKGRFLVVWLTSLPEVDGQFRGDVAEVRVRG